MSDETQTPGTDAPAVADTATTQPSEASETNTNEAPEATQAAEESQQEVKAEDTAEEKLLAGKYKSVEELEKSYKELESKYGKETSEKAELTRILNEAFTTPAESETGQEDTFEEPSTDNKLQQDMAVLKFAVFHQDADGNAIKEILATDPYVAQMSTPEAKLEYAYLRSQNMGSQKAIAEAKKTAASETQAKIVEKQAAKVETARKADTTDEVSELREKATGNYSQEERDAARRALIRKTLVDI